MSKPPPSMQEFDYFAEGSRPVDAGAAAQEGVPAGLEGQLREFQDRQRRRVRVVLLGGLAMAALMWFAWGYRDTMVYAFAGPSEPLPLGDVATLDPALIRHNSYVALTGITEHRGLTQKMVRGLSFSRREYWYFRLLGSQGVFIEVEPDAERYGFATEVRAAGRAVDPDRASSYADLLATYGDKFHPRQRTALRIIQLGVRPREGRGPYVVVFLFIAMVAAVNVSMVRRLLGERRRASQGRRA